MPTPSVALIAPALDLDSASLEVRAITSALPTSPLIGVVTVMDVMQLITRQSWDVLWFATHGTAQGVQLSDGILTISMLIQLVRNSDADLVVLNTCESETAALFLSTQTRAAVICTVAPVGDGSAFVTGSLLAANLAAGMPVRDAFERSRPGDVGLSQRYRLFEQGAGDSVETTSLETRLSLMERDIAYIVQSMNELKRDVRRTPPATYALWALTVINTACLVVLAIWMGVS